MKTQISRQTDQPTRRYSGVYQQQGRMITDADWNEASDLAKRRLWEALRDVFASGAPHTKGLGVHADRTLQPGTLYVDGVPAALTGSTSVAFTAQPDFPGAPPLPGKDFVLYADVWDRAVTWLEDSTLVDSGLHGADTCTRTQTMLQVKWCPAAVNPEDSAQNPSSGDAPLSVTVRRISAGADGCDPCAAEIEVDERVGNYLFRVEVHSVYRDGADTILVLKWSRDNGAEQYPVADAPADFRQGDWAFEFFDDASEKQLGVHLASGFSPRRGRLVRDYTVPTAAGDPKTYARQWDGTCRVNLTKLALVDGSDMGVDLAATVSPDAHGYAVVNAGNLSVNLDLVEIELALSGRSFVAGDHWLAVVREAEHVPGSVVLAAAPPSGVVHHYARLATFDATGALVAQSDAERRRFHFPALTDLWAEDVGFKNTCAALFGSAENVQQALDNLCSVAADDIGWTPPTCATTPSVASLMAAIAGWNWAAQDGDASKTSVNDALTALLCRLDAARLPYNGGAQGARWTKVNAGTASTARPSTVQEALDDLVANLDSTDVPHVVGACGATGTPTVRSLLGLAPGASTVGAVLDALLCNLRATDIPLDPASTCAALLAGGATTVQDAISQLCARSGGCCEATVGSEQADFRTLEEALTALADARFTDVILCLLPGVHAVGDAAATTARILSKTGVVKIAGPGAAAATIAVAGPGLTLEAQEIRLQGVGVLLKSSTGQLRLRGATISVEDCAFLRTSTGTAPQSSMVALVPPSSDTQAGTLAPAVVGKGQATVFWRNNQLTSENFAVISDLTAVLPAAAVTGGGGGGVPSATIAAISGLVRSAPDVVRVPTGFEKNVGLLAAEIAKLSAEQRTAWASRIGGATAVSSELPRITDLGTPLWNWTVRDRPSADSARRVLSTGLRSTNSLDSGSPVAAAAALIAIALEASFTTALELTSPLVGGVLADNRIYGAVRVAATAGAAVDLGQSLTSIASTLTDTVDAIGASLDVRGNRLDRFSYLVATLSSGTLATAIPALKRLDFCHNEVTGDRSALVAGLLDVEGNTFATASPTTDVSAWILADRCMLMGNLGQTGTQTVNVHGVASAGRTLLGNQLTVTT
jgi:hypothetical protein